MLKGSLRPGIALLVLVTSFAVACQPAPSPAAPAPGPAAAPEKAAPPAAAPKQEQPSAKAGAPAQAVASEDWAKVVAAAKQEGTLVLSTHAGPGYEKFAQRIKEALPDLKVDATTMRASDFTARLIVEQKNGQFLWDVHMGPVSNIYSVVMPAGGLEPIKPYLDALPADVKDNSKWYGGFELYTDPGNPVTLITSFNENGGIYINRDQVPEGLARPEDMLDPKWKGKIAIYDPTVANGGSMSLTSLVSQRGDDFLRKMIVDNDAVYVATSRQLTEFIAQGRYPIAIGVDDTILAELQGKGVGTKVERNLAFATYALAYGVSVMKNSPHPNATKVFLNWALSQEGQDAWAKLSSVESNSRRVDVEVYHPNSLPDYKNMDKYKAILGTASGVEALNRVLAITKAR
jgi:iron(III) transport system substrate-binding protein